METTKTREYLLILAQCEANIALNEHRAKHNANKGLYRNVVASEKERYNNVVRQLDTHLSEQADFMVFLVDLTALEYKIKIFTDVHVKTNTFETHKAYKMYMKRKTQLKGRFTKENGLTSVELNKIIETLDKA